MITVTCDRCKKPIGSDECVYVLAAMDPLRLDIPAPITRNHLHWTCVPLYGRNPDGVVDAEIVEDPS